MHNHVGREGEPFFGPIPPDPKTGSPRSHIKGSSWIRDMKTGKEYANTWDVEDRGDELRTSVGGHMGTDKFNVSSNDRAVINHYREVQHQAQRAAYFEKHVFNAVPVPKPSQSKRAKPATPKACPDCEGTGLVWMGDYEETCSRCNGEGKN